MKKTVLGALTMCAGAPLLAFGVGTATAWADTTPPSTHTSAAEQTTPDGGLAISFSGISLVQTGNSTAETPAGWPGNLAIAYNNSHATASGIGNLAIATNNSVAGAGPVGFFNTAIADDNSTALAGFIAGVGNTSIARNGSTAVNAGYFNFVSATNNSSAQALGNFNTVTASDDGSKVEITGNANRITARCGGSVIFSAQSNKVVTSAPCEAG